MPSQVRLYDISYIYIFIYIYIYIAETLIDRAVKLEYIGGTFGGFRAPCKFLCLIQKLLQIQPDMEIIQAYIENEDYKYIRALGAFYLRLVAPPKDCFEILEPLYNDYSKLRVRNMDGSTFYLYIYIYIQIYRI